MSPELFALLARVHGLLAALALAVLLHPVITLRTRRALTRWTLRTSDLGALLLAVVGALGAWLYPLYRARPKISLLHQAPLYADLFESKEHLAVIAIALALGGAITLRVAGEHPAGRRAAWSLLASGWALGVLTAALGLLVASVAHPAW